MHVSHLVVGFHLPRVDLKQHKWSAEHLAWLDNCREDWAKWLADVPVRSLHTPAPKEGYSKAAAKGVSKTSGTPPPKTLARLMTVRTPRTAGGMPPPVTVPEPCKPMLELLASRFSTQQPPVAVTATSSPVQAKIASSVSSALTKAATCTVTRSSEYPTPAEAAQKDVRAKEDRGKKSSPSSKTETSAPKTPSKWNRDESTSPADHSCKKSTKTSAAVEAAEREWD
jgi:hypothetical protein